MSIRFKPKNQELEHKTQVIVHMMHATPIDGMLTYQAMRERLNEPVGSQHPALRNALDDAKDEGMVFDNVPGEGYKRLSNGDTIDIGGVKHRRKVFRGAKRWIRTITTVKDWSTLNGEQRLRAAAQRAVAESIKTTTHGNSVNARIKAAGREPSALDRELQKLSASKTEATT